MRILNILFNYKKSSHDNHVLGVERCFIDYGKYLTKRSHDVICVAQEGISYVEKLRDISKVEVMKAFSQSDIITMGKMFWLFLRFKPEIVVCHSKRALYFARIAKKLSLSNAPLVVINHGVRVEKFLKADYVLAVNSYFTQKLIEAGMDERRAIAVPNMIEVSEDFIPIEKPKFRKVIRLGALGRLYPEKNFDKVLYAMKYLRDEKDIETNFVIGGIGPQQKALEALAKDLDLEDNFKILGWTEDKKKFFEDIDIFLLPSWGETFGIVLLEAMLYNTPIITSDSWGPDEIIENDFDGIKVSRNDAEAMPLLLGDAIKRLNDDQNFAKELAKNAHKKFFERFEANVVVKKLEGLFEKIKSE